MRSKWVNLTYISRMLFAVCIAEARNSLEDGFGLYHLLGVLWGGHSHRTFCLIQNKNTYRNMYSNPHRVYIMRKVCFIATT